MSKMMILVHLELTTGSAALRTLIVSSPSTRVLLVVGGSNCHND
jgi:hypothetical protein